VPPSSMKYNPAFLDDETLVRSFVARNAELDRILEVLRENTGTSNQHLLVIGPRGIGKTTLVLRAAAEARIDPALSASWHPVVFGEETYQVSTPGEFWLEALFHLGEQSGAARWQQAYEELLRENDEDRLRARALTQLMDFADESGKRILLVVENLNMLVGGQISGNDAWVLRQTLMNEPRLMLLGTATSRFEAIDDYNQALYELFRIIELQSLDQQEAQALWASTAGGPAPAHQIRPLQILTGGNPRLIRILSEFAARTSFSSLMDDLTRLVDAHTEYFKHHLDNLPPQERKVFVVLADLWDPSTARTVAQAARVDVNTTSALLKRLADRGAVTSPYKRGRAQYYQVAERMYNVYHLMRRRGPAASRVHAVVRFMVSLYRDEELVQTTRSLVEEASRLSTGKRREHFAAYEAIIQVAREARITRRIVEATRSAFESMPDVPSSLLKLLELDQKSESTGSLDDRERNQEELESLDQALSLNPQDADTWQQRGITLRRLGREEEALESFDRALLLDPDMVAAWTNRGISLRRLDRTEQALEAFERSLALDPEDARAWLRRGVALSILNRHEESLASYDRSLALDEDDAWAWYDRGFALGSLNRHEEALASYDRALALDADHAWAWFNRGLELRNLSRHEEALASYDRTLALDADDAWAWLYRGYELGVQSRHEEALASYDRTLALDADNDWAWFYRGFELSVLSRNEEALDSYDRALHLKPEHRAVLLARGLLNRQLHRFDIAEHDLRQAIKLDPQDAQAKTALVELLFESGRPDDAMAVARGFAGNKAPASLLNGLAWAVFSFGQDDLLDEAEAWSCRAAEDTEANGAMHHTFASILGRRGKWTEALEQASAFLKDQQMLRDSLDESIEFFIDAVAAGERSRVLEVIAAADQVETFEPLVVAINAMAGAQVDVAREISEVAEDVVRRIEDRRRVMRGGSV